MDTIYQAVKELLKSFVNLFVAVINLIAGVINGLVGILGKLNPRASQKLNEISEKGFEAKAEGNDIKKRRFREGVTLSGCEEEMAASIRKELQEKVTSKERYYYLHAQAEDQGHAFYCIILAILAFGLFASTMLYSVGSSIGTRIFAAVIMAALCIFVCVSIAKYRKRILRNRIAKVILEEEFKERNWCKIHPISEVNREENSTGKNELVQRAESL